MLLLQNALQNSAPEVSGKITRWFAFPRYQIYCGEIYRAFRRQCGPQKTSWRRLGRYEIVGLIRSRAKSIHEKL